MGFGYALDYLSCSPLCVSWNLVECDGLAGPGTCAVTMQDCSEVPSYYHFRISAQARGPAEFKHIIKRRKRN
jgi:hypothetical protein